MEIEELNLNRPSKEIVHDLIYLYSGVRFNPSHVKLGRPKALDMTPDDESDTNTFIPVKVDPLYDSEYEGTNGVTYRRLRFDEAGITEIRGDFELPVNTHEFIPFINREFGLQLTTNDLIDIVYPDEPGFALLRANPKSLVYYGEVSIPIYDQLLHIDCLSGFTEYVAPV